MTLTVNQRFPSLNEYIADIAKSRYRGGSMKKDCTDLVYWACKEQKIKKCHPVEIIFTWYEPNKKRDKDNVSSFGRKVILDGLVKAGVLDGDGWKGYGDFSDRFEIDKKKPRVIVELL